MKVSRLFGLLLLTAGAVLVHGYHPEVEDAEIYVPGIKQILNPALYPHNSIFFTSHARLTFFPNLIAASVRMTHLPLDWILLAWHVASIFLLLLACWRFAQLCFEDSHACWGGVAMVAALLTIPVAGTALYIMDQYLNPRSLSTPAILFLIINTVEKKYVRAVLWLLFTGAIHPLMVVFGLSYVVVLAWTEWRQSRVALETATALLLVPLGLFPPVTNAYREILNRHSYFFILRWHWYEWLGIFGPIAILWGFRRIASHRNQPLLGLTCHALIVLTLLCFAATLLVTVPQRLKNFAELQPMRSLQLVYLILFLFAGGFLAQVLLKRSVWRWASLFLPLSFGMFYVQRQLFPDTPHIEWPGIQSANDWVRAYTWIQRNTPTDAYFALPRDYAELHGEDQHGFRAIAERSMLADRFKDAGAVSMFPALADLWQLQTRAQSDWNNFRASDFEKLRQTFGVDWVILQPPGVDGLSCPYQNQSVLVCRVQ